MLKSTTGPMARLFLIILVLFTLPATAQEEPEWVILLRNVNLIDPAGKNADTLVNILIKGGTLDVITEDRISRDEADQVVDANGGFILGKLEVGKSANFMVLDSDPRLDFKVLLDTKTFASFAMHDGKVVRNQLVPVVEEDPDEEPPKTGWLAYTPPPFVVPINYQDTDRWNRWDSRWVSGIFTAGLFLDRMFWTSQDEQSEAVHGDLSLLDGGEIRGLRFGVVGTINFDKPWIYTVFGATNAFDKGFEIEGQDDFSLFDWRLDIPFFNSSVMSIGKQKEPISGERVQSMLFNQMQERSAVSDALLPSRNVGIVWNGSSPEKYTTWAFGVFNDWFDAGQDFNEGASQYIGRLTWAPLHSADNSNLLHVGVGYRYSDAKEGFRYLTTPEFNKSTVFVDTAYGQDEAVLPADNTQTYNFELYWRRGPLLLASEYTRTRVASPAYGNPGFDGYWVGFSWVITGEMRAYNTKSGVFGGVPVSKGVYQSGKGAWELSARWSNLDLDDGVIEGGNLDIASLGLTWWLTPFFGVDANYRYIWNEREGIANESSGLNTRLILILE